jgi:hypothetical protein
MVSIPQRTLRGKVIFAAEMRIKLVSDQTIPHGNKTDNIIFVNMYITTLTIRPLTLSEVNISKNGLTEVLFIYVRWDKFV